MLANIESIYEHAIANEFALIQITFHSARGLYFLTTNRESPYARGTNFTTNTLIPEEAIDEDGSDDHEIVGEAESTA